MMSAAAMGAVAFQKGLGAIHAISHPVGAHSNTHHGTINAVAMPTVLRFNRPAIEVRIARLAGFFSLAPAGFDTFFDFVVDLRRAVGIPYRLRDIGVDDKQFALMAEMAAAEPTAAGNPVPLTTTETRQLLEAAC